MSSVRFSVMFAVAVMLGLVTLLPAGEPEDINFFEGKIRPLLTRHCYECHSGASAEPKGELRVDYRAGLIDGGESGPAIVPGDSSNSLLMSAVRHEGLEMPPDHRLTDDEIAALDEWIRRGAPDPREHPPDAVTVAEETWRSQYRARQDWWSLQPLTSPTLPTVQTTTWPTTTVDRFVLARLEAANLRPAHRADSATLLRRLSLALTGLPPSETLIAPSSCDGSPIGWSAIVDQLLASPHFGEHWARHWMDVVRYTDTYGYEWDIPAKGAWRYRDYLIRAFNSDVPFDQLIREHIAGDLLPEARINQQAMINESLIGLMFYQMGEKRHGDSAEFDGIHQEMLDNKIDALGKAFQATTLACARCHDHKLDAVAQREYYALAGVMMSSRWITNTADLPARHAQPRQALAQLKSKLRLSLARQWLADLAQGHPSTFGQSLTDLAAPEGLELHFDSLDPDNASWNDVLYPWFVLRAAADAGQDLQQTWIELAERYRATRDARINKNHENYELVVDFRDGIPANWSVDGVGLSTIVPRGDFAVGTDESQLVGQIALGGLCTNTLSSRMNGAVRTPWLNTLAPGHLSFEVAGGDFAARRLVVDNAFLTERQQYLNQRHAQWLMVDVPSNLHSRHVYIEFATKTSNPNFPPRVGLGGACSEDQVADPHSWFQLTRVVRHQSPSAPSDELERFESLWQQAPPKTLDDLQQRYGTWLSNAIEAWRDLDTTDSQVRLLNRFLERGLLRNRDADVDDVQLKQQVAEYRRLEQQLPLPWTVNGMRDVDAGFNYPLHIRGQYDRLGEAVPRGYCAVFAGGDDSRPSTERARSDLSYVPGSGRLQLADLMASPDNPLTARVFVNRVWHWLFGAGLVATTDDFGHAGQLPSHPELLDHLAGQFIANHWSVKRLVREIVLSQTWCQSQAADPSAAQVDPLNRLLHHYPLRRMDAESIRDGILSTAGTLVTQLYGPPVNPHRAKEDPQKRLFSGPLDGNGRRSIYTKITIMEPPRFLAAFNQPTPKIPTGRRDVTTNPAQSLVLLNDPFVIQQAAAWAAQMVIDDATTPADRITQMLRRAWGRPPNADEQARWQALLIAIADEYKIDKSMLMHDPTAWKHLAHTIFNTKEFIYVR